jgi:gamma-glutamylcyclotransferase (GGCT)/AIG2-like uncharacterized protein YtfP
MTHTHTIRLFVYGTLQGGERLNHVLTAGGATYISAARTRAVYTLVDLGSFPGLVRDGRVAVEGELWEVPTALLPRLDMIEGAYDRVDVSLAWLAQPGSFRAQTYLLRTPRPPLKEIPGGSWRRYADAMDPSRAAERATLGILDRIASLHRGGR